MPDKRLCACECGQRLPASAPARKKYMDGAHRLRAFRRAHPRSRVGAQGVFAEIWAPRPAPSRFVVTAAVSGSPAHARFLRALERYCQVQQAQLLVVPIRYRNPTSPVEKPEEWFDPKLAPYLTRERRELVPGLMLMADVPTQPTAVRPLSGLTTISGQASAIFGHTKIALESIATHMGEHAKLVLTTGAVTNPCYSSSKAGVKGAFHHVFGAVVVESAGVFHVRHINAAADGSFFDLDRRYDADGCGATQEARVLTLGDLHAVRADPTVLESTFFARDSLVRTLKPRRLILHDVLDFESASHHNNFFKNFALHAQGRGNVMRELEQTFSLIDRIAAAAPGAEIVIVDSNHHDHLERWVSDLSKAHDPENALVYHETKAAMLRELARTGEFLSPLVFWGQRLLRTTRARFLKRGESLVVDNVEYGSHGHRGPNGVRGSIAAFTKVGAKMVIGHSHSPGIMDGVYQTGTSSVMDMGYNTGALSSWMHTHCIHYKSGKRTLINIINGHWRGSDGPRRASR